MDSLPALDALLNATAASLLIAGRRFIARGRERAHRAFMLSAFGCSVLFLASYLYYHAHSGGTRFQGTGLPRTLYLALLASHTALAGFVPILAARTLYLGLKNRRQAHRRWARFTYPVWLYVSFTGVLIYLILYHLQEPGGGDAVAPAG